MTLTTQNLKNLRKACIKNAEACLELSDKMMGLKKWNIATFFAITSREETLKVALLNSLESKEIDKKKFRKYWIHHQSKLRMANAAIAIYVDENGKNPKTKLVLGPKSGTDKILKIREKSLYVDFLEDGTVVEPLSVNATYAIEHYNNAYRELRLMVSMEELSKRLKKYFKQIKTQKAVKSKVRRK